MIASSLRASTKLSYQIAFGLTGAVSVGTSGWLFRDLADLSQWVLKTDRHDVFETFRLRHKIAITSAASAVVNSAIYFRTRCVPFPAYLAVNGTSLLLLYSGYVNPELMMRPRNRDAVYVPSSEVLDLLKREETVIVTRLGSDEPRAYPDSQVLRPHVARVGTTSDGIPVSMTYCGLTNLGIAYEIPNHEDGNEVELVPLTQLENNLVLMDKSTGHIGQQINGISETAFLKKIGGDSYHETSRRPPENLLKEIKLHASNIGQEVPTWRMTLGNFVRTYPNGDVFINDYKEFKDLKNPVKTIYDSLMDYIFAVSVYFQATNPKPVFPTLGTIDPRLPPKEQVWGFNVGDDYVAINEAFVRDAPNGLRNITVGGEPLVAAWDKDVASLGIWRRPSSNPVKHPVDIHGRINGKGEPLERLNTVKNGAFWCVWATFFPQTRVNPES
eukprot:CAMPEP_0197442028 /NCGR_PEP_ID=MMETSP1175-20131217/8135_1 /TAXON_ID=1003142 /ORGANISM="Triceratium dubium, Strain CCMP147" /LENGTH=441 /DNA_ID=CAMNT_0042972417 /DNA_START=130 /DNA_END=1455 /DNA_ORIENTATION=-